MSRYVIKKTILKSVLLILISIYGNIALACKVQTSEFSAMPEVELSFQRLLPNRSGFENIHRFKSKMANNKQTRAAGFQHICSQVIEHSSIFFLFSFPVKVDFHMNNVHAPLDIAFIDEQMRIESIQLMRPYPIGVLRKKTYQSKGKVLFALEAREGFFTHYGIQVGDFLRTHAKKR